MAAVMSAETVIATAMGSQLLAIEPHRGVPIHRSKAGDIEEAKEFAKEGVMELH